MDRLGHARRNASIVGRFQPIIAGVSTRAPRLAALLCFLAVLAGARAWSADYPEMKVLTRDDPLFVQLQAELDGWYRQTADTSPTASARPAPSPLAIFVYRRRGEDLFSLNARLNMPYDTLVTLNAAASRAEFEALPRVLVPTRPGLFVSDPPATALEDMMLSSRVERGLAAERVVVQRGDRRASLWFFPGESFNAVERAYFLRILYEFPIVRGSITSRYGSRADPFTGDPAFHNGIDIGAPVGTPVHAARDGTVAEVGENATLGNYVVLTHPGGWQSVYGHLSSVAVASGAAVATGATIGEVGSTGKSTGPHLHFEVRRKGSAVDPFPLLASKK
jgi:murein DD-endopeptidase MepM/ murein hydrolase activator NlpD